MAGGYQSQVETHAIHHTQTKTKHRVSSDCSISLFVCLATGKRKTLSTGYFLLISYSHLCFLNLCCVCRKLCDLGTSTAGFWSQNDLPELDIHTILCNFSYLPSSLPHSPTLFLSLSLSLALSLLLPVFLPMVVIYIHLSSGSECRSSSKAISVSRGRWQQNVKVNMETQSPPAGRPLRAKWLEKAMISKRFVFYQPVLKCILNLFRGIKHS